VVCVKTQSLGVFINLKCQPQQENTVVQFEIRKLHTWFATLNGMREDPIFGCIYKFKCQPQQENTVVQFEIRKLHTWFATLSGMREDPIFGCIYKFKMSTSTREYRSAI
jgi:hypothetical protein